MKEPYFVALDIETTGSDVTKHQIIQLGVFTPQWRLTRDIGWDEGKYEWVDKALEVNGFNHHRIRAGLSASYIDDLFWSFLAGKGVPIQSVVPIGLNVGSFDVPFVRKYLPKTSDFLSYRSVDLNSVCWTAERVLGRSYDKLKDAAKEYGANRVVAEGFYEKPKPHDAGFDAAQAWYSWEYFVLQLMGNGTVAPA